MSKSTIDEHTRREWRDHGFFYEFDNGAKAWRVVGSRAGLFRFADLLVRYASDPRNQLKSEHDHFGPYMYLKIMTWPDAGISSDSIHGSLDDLFRLGGIVRGVITGAVVGASLDVSRAYAEDCEYSLVLDVRADDFDPSSADRTLEENAG